MQSLAFSHHLSPLPSSFSTVISTRRRLPSSLACVRPLKCISRLSSSLVADEARFAEAAKHGNLVPLHSSIFSDQLTPVTAYRCLVKEDDREAPSFLYESVEPGFRVSSVVRTVHSFFVLYTLRYVEKKKLPFSSAPKDDRNLADIHLGLYDDVIVFDHVEKKVHVIHWVRMERHSSVEDAYSDGIKRLEKLLARLQDIDHPRLSAGVVNLQTRHFGPSLTNSNMACEEYKGAVLKAKEHILAGDIFQIVLSQRFERRTFADPFEVYRALRVARGCILVASSPEILTRVKKNKIVNRPLAGTIRRGKTTEEDEMLEGRLLNDPKQCAEHIMLVDLGRNDVGKVSKYGSVMVEKLMNVERYSHVMHISSTVTGELQDNLSCWDALRAALPVGTVSGAPKVKAMELIDRYEVNRRGPYSGGFGGVSFLGDMDIALGLRTMVFPTGARYDTMYRYKNADSRREWVAYLQAGAGIVADSDPDEEHRECQNKAAGLARAIDLAESVY
ncbi:hypothetical protein GH714_037047 [Hevea brasiliensis]|uniref:Anthranilate synthase n=1 Tax=Hevea brasiliensis TaxID=3981 RepID=A0A6A6L9E9_HEVBR|nr:hypothetical protein GH714_037047 [Hevea brasiliensis]